MLNPQFDYACPEDLGIILNVPANELLELARHANRCYWKRSERKPSGGMRHYRIPNEELKKVQKLIQRKILRHFPVHDSIYSYRPKRNIVQSASMHVGKPVLVKLDIKHFYPHIRPRSVYEMFRERGCSESVAMLLTQLTTCDNQLPQGPPTSPDIANQILTPMVRRISGVCQQHRLTLSAFGDDIFVSGSNRAKQVKSLLFRIVQDEGYPINTDKSGVSNAGEKKIVAGISVSTKLNIPKDYYKKLRAILHHARDRGFDNLFPGLSGRKAKTRIRGMIAHVFRLNRTKGQRLNRAFAMISAGAADSPG